MASILGLFCAQQPKGMTGWGDTKAAPRGVYGEGYGPWSTLALNGTGNNIALNGTVVEGSLLQSAQY